MFVSGPPVHPNCRCVIGPDNIWTDAGDARVCPFCMTLGASWNLSLDTPPSDQQVDEILDREGRAQFKKAIERDSTIADAVIKDAADKVSGGILIEVKTGGRFMFTSEPLTVAIEREAVRKIAEAKARAPLKPGRVIPGMGELSEEVWFEPAPFGRQKPVTAKIATVLIAETQTHMVVRRGGRYLVQTIGGKTIASDDTLALALLILLALAERERRKAEERELVELEARA